MQRHGLTDEQWALIEDMFPKNGLIDWDLFCVDGSSVRAQRSAAGAEKRGRRKSPKTTPWAVPAGGGAPSFTWSPTAKERRWRLG